MNFQLRKRYEKAYALIPELEEMDHSISSLSVKKGKAAFWTETRLLYLH